MLAFRFAKERLLESQKMIVGDQRLPKSKKTPIEIPKDNVATTISEPTEIRSC